MAPIKWNRIFEKIQNKSGKEKITIVVLTGILLLVISLPTGSKSGQTETNENTQTRQTGLSESAKSYETVLEEKLEKAFRLTVTAISCFSIRKVCLWWLAIILLH